MIRSGKEDLQHLVLNSGYWNHLRHLFYHHHHLCVSSITNLQKGYDIFKNLQEAESVRITGNKTEAKVKVSSSEKDNYLFSKRIRRCELKLGVQLHTNYDLDTTAKPTRKIEDVNIHSTLAELEMAMDALNLA